jgi:hypothetical protein
MELKISNQPLGQICKKTINSPWFFMPAFLLAPVLIFLLILAPFSYISPFWASAYLTITFGLIFLGFICFMFAHTEAGLPLAFIFIYIGAIGLLILGTFTETTVRENNWVQYNGTLYTSEDHDLAHFNIEEGSYITFTGMKDKAVYDITPNGTVSKRHTENVKGISVSIQYECNSEFVKQNLGLNYVTLTDEIILSLIKNNPKAYKSASLSMDVCKKTQTLGYAQCPLLITKYSAN